MTARQMCPKWLNQNNEDLSTQNDHSSHPHSDTMFWTKLTDNFADDACLIQSTKLKKKEHCLLDYENEDVYKFSDNSDDDDNNNLNNHMTTSNSNSSTSSNEFDIGNDRDPHRYDRNCLTQKSTNQNRPSNFYDELKQIESIRNHPKTNDKNLDKDAWEAKGLLSDEDADEFDDEDELELAQMLHQLALDNARLEKLNARSLEAIQTERSRCADLKVWFF